MMLESTSQMSFDHLLSSLRRQGSSVFDAFWIPASAGMTIKVIYKIASSTFHMRQIFFTFFLFFFALFPFFLHAQEKIPVHDIYIIHFILDGANADFFHQLFADGKLPTVQKEIVEKGIKFTEAIASFPSVSGANYQSFVTGLFPGHAGIPHLERFDREKNKNIGYLTLSGYRRINDDLINMRSFETGGSLQPSTTIFELLSGHPTASIYSSFYRGASYVAPHFLPMRAIWAAFVSKRTWYVDLLAMRKVFRQFRKQERKLPRYTLVGLIGTDLAGHANGARSKEVEKTLVHFDTQLERFIVLLKKRKLLDKTYIIISSDHGMHDTQKYFALKTRLEKEPFDDLLFVGDRGVASSQIYFKQSLSSEKREKIIETILSYPETELMALRKGEHDAHVIDSSHREATIRCTVNAREKRCSYHAKKDDPLHYCSDATTKIFCDGKFYSLHEWRRAIAHPYFPDTVVQLGHLFASDRSGDIFVIAKPDFGFRKQKAATHGSLRRDDMHIPLLIKGPTISPGTRRFARGVDLYPLLLEWYGLPKPPWTPDGENPL